MDRKAVQLISTELRNVASETLQAGFEQVPTYLRRLLRFVEDTPLLAQAVEESDDPGVDVKNELVAIRTSSARLVPLEEPDGELKYLHTFIRALSELDPDELFGLCVGYAGSRGAREGKSRLLGDTVGRYANQLRNVVTAELLNYDTGEGRSVDVRTTNLGQTLVVVNQGEGDIQAGQQVGEDLEKVLRAIEQLRSLGLNSDELPEEVANELAEIAEVAEKEIRSARPKRWTLEKVRDSLLTLSATYAAVKEPAAVLIDFIVKLIKLTQK